MNKLIKLIKLAKNEVAGGGSIELVVAVILLVFIFISTMPPVIIMYKQQILEQAKMKGLDAMQCKGGLTGEIESEVKSYLEKRGFDGERIDIIGTKYPRQWGEDIAIEITYDDTIDRYKREGLLTIKNEKENIQYKTVGSTVSYYSDNNLR